MVREAGCAIIGATDDLAPADRRLYAIRDVTATVESLPLITASILSKKLAGGPQALVLDVKAGSGAFMPDTAQARRLAEMLVAVARGAGTPTAALITDMDQALGHSAGNALEVAEALDCLAGTRRDARLIEVVLALAAEAAAARGARTGHSPRRGSVRRRGCRMGVPPSGSRAWSRPSAGRPIFSRSPALPSAPHVAPVHAEREGFVAAIDGRAVGLAVIALGGGRTRADQAIDPRVGFSEIAGLGARLDATRPICRVHAARCSRGGTGGSRVRAAVRIADAPPPPAPPVRERIA